MKQPPFPRPSAVVDPRVGDYGPALLALEDGRLFPGIAFGAQGSGQGDLVVNTSQTGYQEIATDPSYAGQLVVMTYPLIGNYGRLQPDDQSERPWLRGLIVANATAAVLDDARQLATMLREAGIPAIAGVDTRALARHLRANGCLRADRDRARPDRSGGGARAGPSRAALGGPGFRGPGLARQAARDEGDASEGGPLVAILDFGLKTNIVRSLRRAGRASASCRTRPRPPRRWLRISTASSSRPDRATRPGWTAPSPWPAQVIADGRPLLGICLGHQIIGRAAGARHRRLPFGHHAANHPVKDLETGLVQVTAQNHEVTVIADTLPEASGFVVSQIDLNDGSVEGLRHRTLPIETVQYHPEGGPGPLDALAVFDRFVSRRACPARRRRAGAHGRQGGAAPPGYRRTTAPAPGREMTPDRPVRPLGVGSVGR